MKNYVKYGDKSIKINPKFLLKIKRNPGFKLGLSELVRHRKELRVDQKPDHNNEMPFPDKDIWYVHEGYKTSYDSETRFVVETDRNIFWIWMVTDDASFFLFDEDVKQLRNLLKKWPKNRRY